LAGDRRGDGLRVGHETSADLVNDPVVDDALRDALAGDLAGKVSNLRK
jgi:hypothetical protein